VLIAILALLALTACGDSGDDDSQVQSELGSDALSIQWPPAGSATAFTNFSSDSTSLQINITGVSPDSGVQVNANQDSDSSTDAALTPLTGSPSIVGGTAADNQSYVITHTASDTEQDFGDFTSFLSALATDIKPTSVVIGVAGTGTFDASSSTFTANAVSVEIND